MMDFPVIAPPKNIEVGVLLFGTSIFKFSESVVLYEMGKMSQTCNPLLDRPVVLRELPHLNGRRA